MQNRLAMFLPAPVIETANGKLILDKKFVSGMLAHVRHWSGPITCFLRRGASELPFGAEYHPRELGFEIKILDAEERATENHLEGYDVALLSGDSHLDLMSPATIRAAGAAVAYSVENILSTRVQIILLDQTKTLPRKIYSIAWTAFQELKRRRAFRSVKGLQANGYPAYAIYGKLTPNQMLYLDNRMKKPMFASDSEMGDRKNHLYTGEPLRLIHSGRLETLKGAQDLVPIAKLLAERGVDFTLTIYGSGSLRDEIAAGISANKLEQRVFLRDSVDFETALVPATREGADIFLSCHRQSDPSCTYVETLGCGVAIIGYDNKMWSALLGESKAGWITPLGNVRAMVDKIVEINAERESIFEKCENGLTFAKSWEFDAQFRRRMEHLAALQEQPLSRLDDRSQMAG